MATATRTITQIPDQYVTVEGLKTHYLAAGPVSAADLARGRPGAALRA
jgi:hypothetical protein